MIRFLQRLFSTFGDYEGPAHVEVFGHDSHVGWVRSTTERIDVLTVKGEAIQLDARARFRLTPITWQALTDATIMEATDRANWARRVREDVGRAEAERDALQDRVGNLRKAFATVRDENPILEVVTTCNAALMADDQLSDDKIPF